MALGLKKALRRFLNEGEHGESEGALNGETYNVHLNALDGLSEDMLEGPKATFIREYLEQAEPSEIESEFYDMDQHVRFSFLEDRLLSYKDFLDTKEHIKSKSCQGWGIGKDLIKEGKMLCHEHDEPIEEYKTSISKSHAQTTRDSASAKGSVGARAGIEVGVSTEQNTETETVEENERSVALSYKQCRSATDCRVNRRSFLTDGSKVLKEVELSCPTVEDRFPPK